MSVILPNEIPNEPLGPTKATDVIPPTYVQDYTFFVGKNVYAELITGQIAVGRLEHVPYGISFTVGTDPAFILPSTIVRMQEV